LLGEDTIGLTGKTIGSTDSEEEIIRRVLAGDKDEFRHLVVFYQDQVLAMIMRQLSNEVDAREIAQEVFLKAYLNLSQFQFKSKFSTWLIRIAINTTNTYFKSKKFKQRQKEMQLDWGNYNLVSNEGEDTTYSEDMFNHLRASISLLKPKHRDVLVLCALENKSYIDAAEILRIPVCTVRSRLFKAKGQVRELFIEALEEAPNDE